MNIPDEELQDKIGRGESPVHGQDHEVIAYQRVFTALSKQQETTLPGHFADKVISKLEERGKVPVLNDTHWLLIGQAAITVILVVALFITSLIFEVSLLGSILTHWGIIISGAAIFIFISFLERKLVRELF